MGATRYINFSLRGPGGASVQVRGRVPSSIPLDEPWQIVGFFSQLAAAGFSLASPAEQTVEAARAELAELMSHMSEERYCAGWLVALEHILWDEIAVSTGSDEADELHMLSRAAGGWMRWPRPEETAGAKYGGAVFVPLDEWEKMHAEWKEKAR